MSSGRPFLEYRDPAEIAAFYSNEDGVTLGELASPKFKHSFEDVKKTILSLPLPKIEVDFIYFYFIIGKSQQEIAHLFNLSQGDVSYRINRILKRLRFVFDLPKIDFVKMRQDLSVFLPKDHVDILIYMAKSSSQTVTGFKMGLSQGRVRYRFLQALKVIKDRAVDEPAFSIYVEFFEKISKNFNILRALASGDYKSRDFMDSLETFSYPVTSTAIAAPVTATTSTFISSYDYNWLWNDPWLKEQKKKQRAGVKYIMQIEFSSEAYSMFQQLKLKTQASNDTEVLSSALGWLKWAVENPHKVKKLFTPVRSAGKVSSKKRLTSNN